MTRAELVEAMARAGHEAMQGPFDFLTPEAQATRIAEAAAALAAIEAAGFAVVPVNATAREDVLRDVLKLCRQAQEDLACETDERGLPARSTHGREALATLSERIKTMIHAPEGGAP